MPVHDWQRVDAGIFHAFHLNWIAEIAAALNDGLLPTDYYALAEQVAGGFGPNVLTLQRPVREDRPTVADTGGIALAEAPPRVQMRFRAETGQYVSRLVAVRHVSDHRVIALLEIVSPGNKSSRNGLRAFVEKAVAMLRNGVHLLVVDLFPPGPRDPQGIHKEIWDQFADGEFILPPGQPLMLASYLAGPCPEAFVEPSAVGGVLAAMPLFLSPETYIDVPLEATYRTAFGRMPAYWRDVLNCAR